MKIKKLLLKNFRCFEDFEIDFNTGDENHGGLTVLVAKNGEGKTAILDAINVAWGPFIGKMPKITGASFTDDDITKRMGIKLGILRLYAEFADENMHESNMFLSDPGFSISRELTTAKKKATTTIKDAKMLTNLALYLFQHEQENMPWPILAYYGDSRLWAAGRVTENKKEALLNRERAYGYLYATNPQAGYREFEQWYADLSNNIWLKERQRQKNSLLFEQEKLDWFNLLNSIIDKSLKLAMEVTGWTKLEYDGGDKQIMAFNDKTGDIVPWTSLSAGNRIVIGLVADIAHRCCILNPWAKEMALKQTPGIVLIDEIELHLHPSWQQQILPTLQRIFPQIQFIVTTHSPQVVSAIPKECVRIIDDGKVVPFFTQTQGVESQDILAEIFGTSPSPQDDEYVKMLNQYARMEVEGKADTDEGKLIYASLANHYGKSYPPLMQIQIHKEFTNRKK